MLKTIQNTESEGNPKKTNGKVDDDSMVSNMVGGNKATNPIKKIRQKQLSLKFG